MDDLPFDEDEEDLAKRSEHIEDGDLAHISSILNSFSKPTCYRQSTSQQKLKSLTTEDALARAGTSQTTLPKFNLNQNSTTLSAKENHLSYFSSVIDEGDSELGDYFSDDEEDDTEDNQDLESENNSWSPTRSKKQEDNFQLSQTAFTEWNPVISSLEAFEEKSGPTIQHISGLLEENQLGFST